MSHFLDGQFDGRFCSQSQQYEKKAIKWRLFLRKIHFPPQIQNNIIIFVPKYNINKVYMQKDINRIKVVLVDKKRTNKWLAEQLGKDPATVSKWCTNSCQPPMETFMKIAELLEVELTELVRFEKK